MTLLTIATAVSLLLALTSVMIQQTQSTPR